MTQLLAVNAGSSSLKLARFALADTVQALATASLNGLAAGDHADALQQGLQQLGADVDVVVHRIVHGGEHRCGPERIDNGVMRELEALVPLAPLHQPVGLQLVTACQQQLPDAMQYACYDTDFHRSLPALQYRLPLPAPWPQQGVRQYGFHGISYQYLSDCLLQIDPQAHAGRVVIAHLGAGASLCAVNNGNSVATTMGFSALDGVPMATRPGRLDAGVLLHLLRQGMDVDALEHLLYHDSGLKALSGSSGDMQALLADAGEAARFAVDYFCDRVAREVAVMASAMGGIDALVFSGGIGEHAASVRAHIMQRCQWLGVQLDAAANQAHAQCLSQPDSPVTCYRLPTDEALAMACQLQRCLQSRA
ncbi:MAG: acetate kinase [Gammaproteobacteria bacterium]|nr:MAG: acetate kinase [Gammaproteobacteria bacterium]